MALSNSGKDIRQVEMTRALADVLVKRAYIAPIGFAFVFTLFWLEPAPWRKAIFLLAIPLMVALTTIEAVRARRGRLGDGTAAMNAAVMSFGMGLVLLATGGIESPGAPGAILNTTLAGVLASRRAARGVWLCSLALIAVLTTLQTLDWFPDAIPVLFGGAGHRPVAAMIVARGLVLAVLTTGAFIITTRVREAFERMGDRESAASRALVDSLAEENRTIALLTAEIAHELKNPLASVKGLAGLVAKDVDGRAADRMIVLRREVDRMQEILEQFLTLSRPLVPLQIAPVDPRALCEEVAALHEGVASERGVRLEVRGAPGLTLAADARKLVQVLTNLVQNALAASPRGGAIVLEAAHEAGVVLRVLDEGPGLPPDLAARAFEPGVTSKPDGSGLGLAIARSLARQHGGALELLARDGGGLAAVVRLP